MAQDSPQQVASIREGEILVGKYRVDHALGVGGTGAVFAAHHLQLDARVAIKFLRPSLLTNQEAVASFIREARAAIQMNNEHVARVFDIGTLVTGAPYMVMEFLDGVDLGTLSQQRGRLKVDEVIDFVLQTCEALAEAHAMGIVHRDLKPTNLFCVRRPDGRLVVKVLDFGISQITSLALSHADRTLAQPPVLMGTPLYMSPEQIEASEAVDARADIWALGVILCELLTGKTPFPGETVMEVSIQIAAGPAPPFLELMAAVPDGLAAVIDTCLERDRQKRYSNVAELASALLPFGPKRARLSVERINDILQIPGRLTPSVPSLPATTEPTRQPVVAATERSSDLNLAPAGPAGRAGRRRIGRTIVAGTLGLVGVALGMMTLDLVSTRTMVPVEDTSQNAASAAVITAPTAPRTAPPTAPTSTTPSAPTSAPSSTTTASRAGQETSLAVAASPGVGKRETGTSPRPRASARGKLPAALPRHARRIAAATATALPGQRVGATGVKADCSPSFEFDDQGRRHFKPECLMVKPGAPASASATNPKCNPSFDLDDQGRKHFKPECFVNSR